MKLNAVLFQDLTNAAIDLFGHSSFATVAMTATVIGLIFLPLHCRIV